MVRPASLLSGLLGLVAPGLAAAIPAPAPQLQDAPPQLPTFVDRSDDWSCRSAAHPNPVVLLHGLFASEKLDLNVLEAWLRRRGFCTFAPLYGSYTPRLPVLGGLKPVTELSREVAAFIRQVHNRTGAARVDVVGHSEGGFLALYAPK